MCTQLYVVGLQTVSSLERCPLFGVSFIERFPLFCAFSLISGACWLEAVFGCDSLPSHLSFHSYLPSHFSPTFPPTFPPTSPPLPSPPLPSLSVQFALLSSSQEVRVGGLRVLRYILVTKEIFEVMCVYPVTCNVTTAVGCGAVRALTRRLLCCKNIELSESVSLVLLHLFNQLDKRCYLRVHSDLLLLMCTTNMTSTSGRMHGR